MKNKYNPFLHVVTGACLLACKIALLACPLPASAGEGQAAARRLNASGTILSLEKITESAKKVKPGHILETELERKEGGYIYEIEILDAHGQVWEVKLDAKTGKLIQLESED